MKWSIHKRKANNVFESTDIHDLELTGQDIIDMYHGATFTVKTKCGDLIVINRRD